MKKYLKQEHVTTVLGLFVLALNTGLVDIPDNLKPFTMFVAGALVIFGYTIPEAFTKYFKKDVPTPDKPEDVEKVTIKY